jgi:hypothetical protein
MPCLCHCPESDARLERIGRRKKKCVRNRVAAVNRVSQELPSSRLAKVGIFDIISAHVVIG